MESWIYLILIGGFAFALYVVISAAKKEQEASRAFIENHKKIHPGMTKVQVINILGSNYTQSYLKSGIEKLEWRHRQVGYSGRIAKGAYVHTSSLTRRISVKFKDNVVVEVNCLNMD